MLVLATLLVLPEILANIIVVIDGTTLKCKIMPVVIVTNVLGSELLKLNGLLFRSRHEGEMRTDKISLRFIHDTFVYWLHGLLTGHETYFDTGYYPPKPMCRCGK